MQNAKATQRPLTQDQLRDVRGGQPFQKITWTWNDGGVTAGDDWEARV
jgi:hypothetical protein